MTGRDEDLDYISSSPLLGGVVETNIHDEEDVPTLKQVLALIDAQIAAYKTIDTLNLSDPNFTVEEQLEVNSRVVTHLLELKVLVENTLGNIKEKYA